MYHHCGFGANSPNHFIDSCNENCSLWNCKVCDWIYSSDDGSALDLPIETCKLCGPD